jgi:two-component system, chemotaxis family, chemotaxis protein CheY
MNILLVDDSGTIRKISKRILQELNFHDVLEAEDGIKALEVCSANMPDLILLDWNMPNMNGLEFLKKLRSTPEGAKPKVIFCTTENTMEFLQEGMTAGADEYIMKPFDKTVIETKLIQLGFIEEKL